MHLNGKSDNTSDNNVSDKKDVVYVTVYKCDICDKDFDDVTNMKNHKDEEHKNENDELLIVRVY